MWTHFTHFFFNVLELGNPALGFSFSEYEKRKRLLFSSLKSYFSTAIVKRDKEKAWHGCSFVVQWLDSVLLLWWPGFSPWSENILQAVWHGQKKTSERDLGIKTTMKWQEIPCPVSRLTIESQVTDLRLSVDGRHNQLTGWWDIPLTAPIFLS